MTMVLAMAVPAMAATITINPADTTGIDNTTYTAYKIFDATKQAGGDGVAYSVDAQSPWLPVLQNSNQTWVTLTSSADGSQYTVTKTDSLTDTTAADFAKYLNTNKPSTLTGGYAGKFFNKGTNGKYVTSNIDEGYYLVTSSLGTNLILDTTKEDEITEKNNYPTDKKEAETASVSVGENATYYITVTVPANVDTTKPITVHDQLPAELKFNNDVQVYVSATPQTEYTLAQKKNFTYSNLTEGVETVATTGSTLNKDDSFTITINTGVENNLLAGKTLVFKYSAQLLSTAVSDTEYVNKEYIDYSNYTSNTKTAETKTYDFNVIKTDSKGNNLTGAEFELRKTADQPNTAIAFNEVKNNEALTGYKKADSDDANTVTTLKAGSINIAGLGAGTYFLVETKAPDGYNKLQSAITVSIADNGTITFTPGTGNTVDTNATDTVKVQNNKGTELPSTGGMGTTIFYVLGAALVIGAGVVLVTRRRLSK